MTGFLIGFIVGAACAGFIAVFWRQLVGRGGDIVGKQ